MKRLFAICMKNLRTSLVVIAIMPLSLCVNAQSVLDNLTFEGFKKYILPKGEWAPLRTSPSAKAAKVTEGTGAYKSQVTLLSWNLRPVLQETQNWYKVNTERGRVGWISKSNAKVSIAKPITKEMMNTNQAGNVIDEDLGTTYRVYSPVGSHEFAVAQTYENGMEYLRLGKLIDNVFVFKYKVEVIIYIDEENPKEFNVQKEEYPGERIVMKMNVGTNFCTHLKPGFGGTQPWALDLSKLNDKVLIYIFGDAIKKNDVLNYYINADLLSGEYANFFM